MVYAAWLLNSDVRDDRDDHDGRDGRDGRGDGVYHGHAHRHSSFHLPEKTRENCRRHLRTQPQIPAIPHRRDCKSHRIDPIVCAVYFCPLAYFQSHWQQWHRRRSL
jgi:hypothetical protein